MQVSMLMFVLLRGKGYTILGQKDRIIKTSTRGGNKAKTQPRVRISSFVRTHSEVLASLNHSSLYKRGSPQEREDRAGSCVPLVVYPVKEDSTG